MSRLRALATWQVAGPIALYVLISLLVALYAALVVALHNGQARELHLQSSTTVQINQLQTRLVNLERELRTTQVHGARKRGQLAEAIQVLEEQIRQLGGKPVVEGLGLSSSSSSLQSPKPKASSQPTAAPKPTTATPRPSPTCTQIPGTEICVPTVGP